MKQYFLSLKNKLIRIFNSPDASEKPTDVFTHIKDVASFIVLPTGQIKSSNKTGTYFVEPSKGYLNNLLIHDGFDNATAYRLLNTFDKHAESNHMYIYKSELLPDNTFLVSRHVRIPVDVTQTVQDNADNDIEVLNEYFDTLPIGYFETNQQGVISEQHDYNNQIISMNKTLRDWVKNDSELLDHLAKFGSADAKRSMGIVTFGTNEKTTYTNINTQKIFRIFKSFVDNDFPDQEGQQKVKGFIVPMDLEQQKNDKEKISFPLSLDIQSDFKNTNIDTLNTSDISNFDTSEINKIIFKNNPLATIILNPDNKIIDYNQAFSDLFQTIDCQSEMLKDYFSEAEYTQINNACHEHITQIQITNMQNRILNMKICFDDSNNQKICYFSDVSSEKNLEQKFNQAQKMQAIGQLAGGVAHDFNNLLTAILGHTELLMNRFSVTDLIYADLLQIRNNANRAGNLVRQLLAFSRKQVLKPEIIILTDILPDISRMLERLLGDRIQLKTNYAPSLKPIKADITQLEQVIINLGVNARDAMEANGGVLTITTENILAQQAVTEGHNIMPAMDYVKITVSDTGHGMSDDIKTKIFEPFFTTKEQGKGTGLGLSTVYGIVKQSEGFIFVDSEQDKGTQFRVYFPITLEQKKHISVTVEETENHDSLVIHAPHTKTILIVEDEESVRSFAVRALELRGYNILQADCGEEGLEIFKENHESINLIVTDVMMPGLSGPEWIQQAQKIKHDLNVIFMSGYTQDYFRDDDAFNLSGVDITFLSKPFSLKNFNEIVQNKIT